jgi:acetyl-CoA carboxylase biotin carboxyl carrier protein
VSELSFAEVGEILRLVQCIDGADVELEWGDLRIHVQRGVVGAEPLTRSGPEADGRSVRPAEVSQARPGRVAPTPPIETDAVATGAGHDDDLPEHWVPVTAPMAGTVYRAPKPDEPPFVEVGDTVASDDTVALVEVMKLFTELKAGVAGKVARIDAEDGGLVEFGQDLIWIEPV